MLLNLLPGLREIRAPLISGYLWLVFFFLALRDDLPTRSHPGSALQPLFELGDHLSIIGLATVASVAAYLTGSAMQELLKVAGKLISPRHPLYGEAGTHLSTSGKSDIRSFVEIRLQRVRRRLYHVALVPGEQGVEREPTEASIEKELPLIRTLLLDERPELVGELDRLQAEADLRITVAAPLAVLGAYLAGASSPGWLALFVPAGLLMIQGYQRQLEVGDLLAKALRIGKANAPSFESLEASVEAALERMTLEEELEEELNRKGDDASPRTAFRLGNLLTTTGNYEAAARWLEFAAGNGVIQAHAELGVACEQLDDLDAAERAYRKGFERKDEKARQLLVELLGRLDRGDEALDVAQGDEVEKLTVAEPEIPKSVPAEGTRISAYRQRIEMGDSKAALNLGLLLERRDDLDEAAWAYRKATELNHGDEEAWLRLGEVEKKRIRFADACEALERAVSIKEKKADGDDFGLASMLGRLGNVLTLAEKFEKSIECLRRAIAIQERETGNESHLLFGLQELGYTLMVAGYYPEAMAEYRRAGEIRKTLYGEESPITLMGMGGIGSIMRLQGEPQRAVLIYEKVLRASEEIYGESNLMTGRSTTNLGNALRDAGRVEEALKRQERAVEIFKAAMGPDHPELAQFLENQAQTLLALGRPRDARVVCRRALDILRAAPSTIKSETGVILRGLAMAELDLGEISNARASAEEALRMQGEVLRPEHPEIAPTLGLLSRIAGVEGREEQALEFDLRMEAIRRANQNDGGSTGPPPEG